MDIEFTKYRINATNEELHAIGIVYDLHMHVCTVVRQYPDSWCKVEVVHKPYEWLEYDFTNEFDIPMQWLDELAEDSVEDAAIKDARSR